MKHSALIHRKTGFVVAEYRGEKTIIYDRVLEKEMALRGVVIPLLLREEYGGKTSVRSHEKEFQKAFKELYFHQVFNPLNYLWE